MCVLFFLFSSCTVFVCFGRHVVELVKRRIEVRSDWKSVVRISRYDFLMLTDPKRIFKYPLILCGALKFVLMNEGRFGYLGT